MHTLYGKPFQNLYRANIRCIYFIALTLFALTAPRLHSHLSSDSAEQTPTPWLTGPLLAPTGTVTPYGNFEIEPYAYFTAYTGMYSDDWKTISAPDNFFSFNNQYVIFIGLTSWMDINILPQFFINSYLGKTSTHFGDFTAGFDFQLYPADLDSLIPGVKISLQEVFPTGSFQNFNQATFSPDQTGQGTFGTNINLVFYKVYHLAGRHFMSVTVSGAYQINSSVHVHGYNSYGGGVGTNGKIVGGNIFEAVVSFEFTFDQNWGFAIDNVYIHKDRTVFSGVAGISPNGAPAFVGTRSTEQISFAPAIEYNISENMGLIAGCWFTAFGRNSSKFASGVVEFVYTYY